MRSQKQHPPLKVVRQLRQLRLEENGIMQDRLMTSVEVRTRLSGVSNQAVVRIQAHLPQGMANQCRNKHKPDLSTDLALLLLRSAERPPMVSNLQVWVAISLQIQAIHRMGLLMHPQV